MLLMVYAATFKRGSVSGPLLQEKALQVFPVLYPYRDLGSFKASSGWFHKFCCRHGMRSISLQGDSLSADTSGIDAFKNELINLMEKEGYTLSQLFDADYDAIKNLCIVNINMQKFKYKYRVTLLASANSTGTCKLPLMFIHKSQKPHCFKHMDMKLLLVHYYDQKKTWMDSHLFKS